MKIAVIGLGYVGLPLSLQFCSSGVKVIGLDLDPEKMWMLREGRSYIRHIPDATVEAAVRLGGFEPADDFSRIQEVSAVIVCVPTPLNKHREPDISYVLETARTIAPYLGDGRSLVWRRERDRCFHSGAGELHVAKAENGATEVAVAVRNAEREHGPNGDFEGSCFPKLVVLESTTYPGTTDEDFRCVLEEGSGLKAGEGFYLAFSPEREDPGNPLSLVGKIPKVVGGYTSACLNAAMDLYGQAIETLVPVSTCRAAEATKLLENIFRSVNIALVNELKMIYETMGVDIWEVIEAAKTKPFGYMPFYPGPGFGGHCIPIDPFYLSWKAREFGEHTRFIELAGEINTNMRKHVMRKVTAALNRHSKPVRGSRVLVIGLAYKADVDDMRESPTFALMDALKADGAEVSYFDPFIPVIPSTREHGAWTGMKSIEWGKENVAANDCVIISTAHSSVPYGELGNWCDCIVDTRNAMAKVGVNGDRVVKA